MICFLFILIYRFEDQHHLVIAEVLQKKHWHRPTKTNGWKKKKDPFQCFILVLTYKWWRKVNESKGKWWWQQPNEKFCCTCILLVASRIVKWTYFLFCSGNQYWKPKQRNYIKWQFQCLRKAESWSILFTDTEWESGSSLFKVSAQGADVETWDDESDSLSLIHIWRCRRRG